MTNKNVLTAMLMASMASLNLQLFAYDPQTQPENHTGADALSAEMKTYYDTELIEEAQAHLVHDQFGQKRPIPKGRGKTVEFRKFAPLAKATTPLTEGVTPEGKSLEVTDITAEVRQYGDFVTQTDMLELTAIDNTILEATTLLGQQAGATLDTITREHLHSGANVFYCPKIAEDGTETEVLSRSNLDKTSMLTVDVCKQVVAKLRAQNAPTIDGYYIAIIHPYVAYDLMSDKDWTEAHKYTTPETIYKGEIGKIAGVRFVETTEAKIYKGAGCPTGLAVFGSIFLGANAYGVTEIEGGGLETIIKQKGSGGTSDPLNQRSSVGWKATKTAELLVPQYLVRVESCSKRFSATAEAN